jgi:aminotransferase
MDEMTQQLLSRRLKRAFGRGPSLRPFFDILATMGDTVISLGVGEPDFPTPGHIVASGIRALQQGRVSYTSTAGTREVRQAVSAHLEARYGVAYDPMTQIVVTTGVSEALAVAMLALVDPGDEVIVVEPCFTSYAPVVAFASGEPVLVGARPEEGFEVAPADVEAAVTPRTKAILLGYPNNPTGATLSRDKAEALVEIARRHGVVIISDEIYDRLTYDRPHVCFGALAPELVVLLGGFSKDYAMTGWRIGYLCAPPLVAEAMLSVHENLTMCVSMMAQDAAVEALSHGEPEVLRMVGEYDRRRRAFVEGLNAAGLPTHMPGGAFYAFSQVSHLRLTDVEFCERFLMEERVALIPGSAFGPSGTGYVRSAYVKELDVLEEVLRRLRRFLTRLH